MTLSEPIHATPAQPPVGAEEVRPLIGYILDRFHAVHRAELDMLVPLARKVEAVHAAHPACPRGLGDFLAALREELEAHMAKEEKVLFPLLIAGGAGCAPLAIRRMRLDHDDHEEHLKALKSRTACFEPPSDACRSRRALYAGCRKLEADLREHIRVENEVLFPAFE